MACKHLNNSFLGLVTLKDNKNIYVYIYVQTIEKKKNILILLYILRPKARDRRGANHEKEILTTQKSKEIYSQSSKLEIVHPYQKNTTLIQFKVIWVEAT